MVFPATPRELVTEMFIGGVWVDISADVRGKDVVHFTSGKSDRSSSTSPSTSSFTLNNGPSKVAGTLGQRACYSLRNPVGPYYERLTRNTQIRQKLRGLAAPAFDASSSAAVGSVATSWTHTGASSATGVLVWVLQSGSTSLQTIDVTYGGVTVPSVHSVVTATGRIYTYYLGTNVPGGAQTVAINPSAPGPALLPVSVTVTGGDATELNNGPLPASTTNTTANPSLSVSTTQLSQLFGVLHSGQDAVGSVTAGAGYTDVLENDFGTDTGSAIRRTTGTTTSPTTVNWTATADTWTAVAYAISAVSYRFWGEMSDLPNTWDVTATDADAQVQAAGILRRIQQGDRPIFSALREYLSDFPSRSYWPLDDGSGSATGRNLGEVAWAFYRNGAWIPTSGYGATFDGDLQPLSSGFQMSNPDSLTQQSAYGSAAGPPGSQVVLDYVYRPNITGDQIFQIRMNGLYWLNVRQRHDGVNNDFVIEVQPSPYGGGGGGIPVNIASSAKLFELVDYQVHHVRATFVQTGGDVNATIYLDGVSVVTGLIASMTLDTLTQVGAYFTPLLDGAIFTIGHVAVWDDTYPPPPLATAVQASQLWLGEMAADRFARLCTTADFPFVVQGTDSIPMGQQGTDYFSNQLSEIEATDLGMIYEPRDQLAVGYRTRSSLYNQDATVTASYTARELATGFSPIEDDAGIRNDVFAQRRNGGSFQATKLTGPLSVVAPPNGVGRYKDEVPVNVQTDDDLPAIAGWLLNLGTVDEPRFAQIRFDLALPGIVANPALADALLRIAEGDRLQVTATSALGLYDGVSQIVLGRDETLSQEGYAHEIIFNCAPASAYEVAEFDDGVSRFDPGEYSTVNAGMTTTATTMQVLAESVNGAFAYWTTNAAMMPISIKVSGEEMTVTAIAAGVAGVQNFTVVRSVNGVVKTQSAGAQVYLKRPTIFAL